MKLEEALADLKAAIRVATWDGCYGGCMCVTCCAERLVSSLEAHLRAEEEKRNIYRQAFGFEPIRRY